MTVEDRDFTEVADDETWVFASSTNKEQLVELGQRCGIEWEGFDAERKPPPLTRCQT
jgi:hypothetical protein